MLSINEIVDRIAPLTFAESVAELIKFDSYERSPALVLVLGRAPTAADVMRTFLDWGNCCDAPWANRSILADSLRRARRTVSLLDFLDPEARKFYDALPHIAPVWRGCEKGRERGLHWSTDRAVAEGFARGKRCTNKRPTLVQALIPKPHIFAVFLDRKESEIVLDPRRLRKVSAIDTDPWPWAGDQ